MGDKQTYTAAVVGCGQRNVQASQTTGGFGIAKAHAQGYAATERVRLVAACDINEDNLNAYADEQGVEQRFTDYETMLRDLKPDVVSICTYVGLHRPMIEQAAEAGVKGVICEKPFVLSPADLKRVWEIAQNTGLKICIAHQRTTTPAVERARELYNDGTVGERRICVKGAPDWDLSEMASHWMDEIRYFNNDDPIDWVMGQFRVTDKRGFNHAIEDHGMSYFRFQNGGFGLIEAGHPLTTLGDTVLIGTEGQIQVHGEKKLIIQNSQGQREEECTDGKNDFQRVIEGLADWLDGGDVPITGLPRTYHTAELNHASYLSGVKNDRIDLPLGEDELAIDEWPVEILARRSARGF